MDRNLRGLRRNVTISVMSAFTCANAAETVNTWCLDGKTMTAQQRACWPNNAFHLQLTASYQRMSALEGFAAQTAPAMAQHATVTALAQMLQKDKEQRNSKRKT